MNTETLRLCRTILFDFGGTLDSDGEHWLDRFYELYEHAGLDIPRPEIKRVFYQADDLCCRDPLVNHLGLRALMEHHVHLQLAALQLDVPEAEQMLVEGFCSKTERVLRRNAELLQRLRSRYRLGVVSNFYGNVAVLCEEAGLAQLLGVVVDSTRVGLSKPDPGIFEMAVRAIGGTPQETIFVGDSYERDMMPAQKMGMHTVWMKGPNPRLPENPQPVDCCITHLTELDALIA